MWPDGLVVDCGVPNGDPLPPPRAFEGQIREGESLEVLVGVTQERGANLPPTGEPANSQRYFRASESVDDFNSGGAPQDVEFAVPNLRLVFGPEQRDRMVTLPVAQLVRQPSGNVVLRDAFVPPA